MPDQKASWRRKGLVHLYFHITVHQMQLGRELKHDMNLEEGADAELMEALCLLICSLWFSHSAFFIVTRTKIPGLAPHKIFYDFPHPLLI